MLGLLPTWPVAKWRRTRVAFTGQFWPQPAEDLRRNLAPLRDRRPGGRPSHELDFPPSLQLWRRPQVGPKLSGEVEPGLTGKDTGSSAGSGVVLGLLPTWPVVKWRRTGVAGWAGRGPWPWQCSPGRCGAGLGTRTANRKFMIASFGNLTLLVRVEFPKLAIMTRRLSHMLGRQRCFTGRRQVQAEPGLTGTAPSPTPQGLAQHRDDQ